MHPTAGAVAIGARPFLVAYNVYLGPASNLAVAKEVAKAVRGSSGGLRYVKALGLEVDGQAQVSMNLVDTEKTPLHRAFDMVQMEAEARGVTPTWSEIVGLVPERALFEAAARHVQLRNFSPDMVLEQQGARAPCTGGEIAERLRRLRRRAHARRPAAAASPRTPARSAPRSRRWSPASRSARRSTPPWTPRCASSRVRAAALGNTLAALVDARRRGVRGACPRRTSCPARPAELDALKRATIDEALLGAADVPLETARACAEVAELALAVAERGNTNAASDAGVAALLAEAGCVGASYNVRINVAALGDRSRGARLVADAARARRARA